MLKVTNNMQESDLIKTIERFLLVIHDDPVLALSFLLNIQENPIKISQKNIPDVKQKIENLINILKIKLDYFPFLKLLKPIEFETTESISTLEDFDLYKTIQNCINDVLIKYSSKEIENFVNTYFNPKKRHLLKLKNIDEMLYKIFEILDKKQQTICLEYFVFLLEENEAKKVLEYFIKRIEKVNTYLQENSTQNNSEQTNVNSKTMQKSEKLNCDLSLFFTVLYLKNKEIYRKCVEIIFNESYFTRLQIIKVLPSYELQFKEGFISEDLARYVLEYKPLERILMIKYLYENKKKLLIKLIKDLYYIFDIKPLNKSSNDISIIDNNIYDLKSLDLTFEEHIDICTSVDEHIFFYFENLHYYKNLNIFINLLTKKDDEFVIQFFTKYLLSQNMFYETVVVNYLKIKKLPEKLQHFFVSTFVNNEHIIEITEESTIRLKEENVITKNEVSNDNLITVNEMKEHENNKIDNILNTYSFISNVKSSADCDKTKVFLHASFIKEVFFILSQYLSQEQLVKHLEKFCIDDITLIEFLKVMSPEELYLNVHYFTDTKKSLHVTQLISQKKEIFNASVCKYVILEMEKRELPVLFMRTVIVSLISFISMKDFVISLMFRLVKAEIWKNKQLYNGFLKCLSFCGNAAFDIIMCMPEQQMKDVLNDEKILKASEKYVKKSGLKGRCAFLFKNAVYSQLKKKNK